ncbi:MAG: response regulator [Pyrinomonadaceae bacterium]|nr:response regulator [Pyrinomonadaceae bacterium]MDQ3134444.1 response regulator [Acidobacteriota bacterium]
MGKKYGSGPTILVVDDDPELRELVSFALTREGFDVAVAENAFIGLARLDEVKPAVTLLDVMMPGMSGLEMLARLREHDRDMPIIIMTAAATPDIAFSALRDEACDFLAKPFHLDDLISAVSTAFEMRQQQIGIEVLSARPDWIEFRVPCNLQAIEPLERMLLQLKTDIPPDTRDQIAYAFREMLRNAIEHGGKYDPTQRVEVGYLRTARMILYRLKDPGAGFTFDSLQTPAGPIAGVLNPADDPTLHMRAREELGLRPGGFGILIARSMADEVCYNERHNEVILIKYLDGAPLPPATAAITDERAETTTESTEPVER